MIIIFIIVIIISLSYTLSIKSNLKRFLISFWLLSVFVYSYSSIPQIILNGPYHDTSSIFLLFTSLSIISVILGFKFSEKIRISYFKNIILNEPTDIPSMLSILSIISLLIIINIKYYSLMPSFGEMFSFSRYEYIKNFQNPNNILGVLILFISGLLSGLGVHLSFLNYKKNIILSNIKVHFINLLNLRLSSRVPLYIITLFLSIILLTYLLARGDRNPIMILLVPFLSSILKIENIKRIRLIILFLFSILLAQLLDVFRAITLSTTIDIILGNSVEKRVVFPINDLLFGAGEFTTPLKTFDIYLKNKFEFDSAINQFPGFSYLFDVPLNFLGTFKLAENTTTIAGEFSEYFGSKGMGIGFSHQLEAFINFGWFGSFLPYFVFGLIIGLVSKLAYEGNIFWKTIYYSLIPLIINMQRIDIAVIAKLFVYSSMGVSLYFILNNKYKSLIKL